MSVWPKERVQGSCVKSLGVLPHDEFGVLLMGNGSESVQSVWDSGTPTHTTAVFAKAAKLARKTEKVHFFLVTCHTHVTQKTGPQATRHLFVFFGLFSLETRESRPLFFTLVSRPTTTHALRRSSQPVMMTRAASAQERITHAVLPPV